MADVAPKIATRRLCSVTAPYYAVDLLAGDVRSRARPVDRARELEHLAPHA